ncbi:hypothetical protein [Gelidibacter maritimus]|uniref:Uncharacterized protein n=1 Tax=Gelidibacter maritimus TaxID=2761487 RepID=A0A7W2M7Q2_9FLAO|nr:hypothetical protein [Gelidibacter maritimus]MBA6154218.1 hypothetical protein [Gelidibacter maritimus]
MKSYQQLLVISFISIFMSCDFSKNNSPDHSTTGRTVPENQEITNTTNYQTTGNFDTIEGSYINQDKVTDSLGENWNLDNPKRKEDLYAAFDMTEEQIQRYENAIQNWKESETEDAFKLLSANAKIKEEDKILKNILDDEQYSRYKDWSRANDLRN